MDYFYVKKRNREVTKYNNEKCYNVWIYLYGYGTQRGGREPDEITGFKKMAWISGTEHP
jgi:hypothetical protein